MSIINDHAGVNRAMQSLQPPKVVRNNGLYQCHRCLNYLGELPIGTVTTCPSCNAPNRVVED